MKFKVGDKILIRKTSEFYHTQGMHGIGTITSIDSGAKMYYNVSFKDYTNCYGERDLILATWQARYEE